MFSHHHLGHVHVGGTRGGQDADHRLLAGYGLRARL